MTQKQVTINGRNYPVIFTLKTLIGFEQITNQSFLKAKLDTTTDRMALVMAAILAANPDPDLQIEDMQGQGDWAAYVQINKAFAEVMALAAEFFPIPEVEKGKDPEPTPEAEQEGSPKN